MVSLCAKIEPDFFCLSFYWGVPSTYKFGTASKISKYSEEMALSGPPETPMDHFQWVQRGATGPPTCEI